MTFTISGVTLPQLEAMKAKFASDHATQVIGDLSAKFDVSGHGVDAECVFDATAGTVTVTITHHPFWLPVEAIQNAIEKALSQEVADGQKAE